LHGISAVCLEHIGKSASFNANDMQVIQAMQPWKKESQFGDLLVEESAFCASEFYLET
jgi:hypothetical protein